MIADALAEMHIEAERGCVRAQYELSEHYCESSYRESVKWRLLAAEQGHVRAQRMIGEMYEHGLGCAQNWEVALRYYRRAAAQGDSESESRSLRVAARIADRAR
jgi:TPR repeat protein